MKFYFAYDILRGNTSISRSFSVNHYKCGSFQVYFNINVLIIYMVTGIFLNILYLMHSLMKHIQTLEKTFNAKIWRVTHHHHLQQQSNKYNHKIRNINNVKKKFHWTMTLFSSPKNVTDFLLFFLLFLIKNSYYVFWLTFVKLFLVFLVNILVYFEIFWYVSHVPLFIHIYSPFDDVLMWNIFTGGSYIMRLSTRTTNNKLPAAVSYCKCFKSSYNALG